MLERQVIVPVGPEALWEALTQPDELDAWFGQHVEWDLVPGGRATWTQADGEARAGVIDDVSPARRLAYRWWPQTGEGPATAVTYELEGVDPQDPPDDGDGPSTRLTVREASVATPEEAKGRPTACAVDTAGRTEGWTPADTQLLTAWLGRQVRPLVTV